MKRLGLIRFALGNCAAAALLSGCGALNHVTPPIGAPPGSGPLGSGAVERVLYSFAGGTDGEYPGGAPTSIDGDLYGTTALGGNGGCRAVHGCGTIYKVSASGQEGVLHVFKSGKDGEAPSGLLIHVRGSLFGTTIYGGGPGCKLVHTSGCGTMFEVTPSGKERVLYRFPGGAQGALPDPNLTVFKGAFYGEAEAGGTGKCNYTQTPGCGLIFKMSPSGRINIVYTFKGGKDAATPEGGLVFFKGNFYGTTSAGGRTCSYSYRCGTVFKMTPSGSETVLYAFKGRWNDGAAPGTGLVVLNGALYGTTFAGGKNDCALYGYGYGCGTVFKVTLSGQEQIIHNFKGGLTDGNFPNQLLAIGGNLYGTTGSGGDGGNHCYGPGCGTVFKMTPSGQETILYSFKGGDDGNAPTSGLIEASGTLYGTTAVGGTHGDGTVYAITR